MNKLLSLFATLCLALPCAAVSTVPLQEASPKIHANHSGQLISCNGANSSDYVIVSLPDGTETYISKSSLIQVINDLCDLNKPWSAGHAVVVYCIAK